MQDKNPSMPIPNYDWTAHISSNEDENFGEEEIIDESPGIPSDDVETMVQQYIGSIPKVD